MTVAKNAPKLRSILITQLDGARVKVNDIPASAKITFGPVQPGGKDGGYGGRENVLRIYTSASNQLAVFRNVQEFRDLSLNVTREVLVTEDDATTVTDVDGSEHSRSVRRRYAVDGDY